MKQFLPWVVGCCWRASMWFQPYWNSACAPPRVLVPYLLTHCLLLERRSTKECLSVELKQASPRHLRRSRSRADLLSVLFRGRAVGLSEMMAGQTFESRQSGRTVLSAADLLQIAVAGRTRDMAVRLLFSGFGYTSRFTPTHTPQHAPRRGSHHGAFQGHGDNASLGFTSPGFSSSTPASLAITMRQTIDNAACGMKVFNLILTLSWTVSAVLDLRSAPSEFRSHWELEGLSVCGESQMPTVHRPVKPDDGTLLLLSFPGFTLAGLQATTLNSRDSIPIPVLASFRARVKREYSIVENCMSLRYPVTSPRVLTGNIVAAFGVHRERLLAFRRALVG